jgi:hypothetical protein
MRWFWALFAVAVVLLFVGVSLAEVSPLWVALGPVFWMVAGQSVRCPRCTKHVNDNGRGYYALWIKTPKSCVGCGRSKAGIWPFQWLVRSERE